MEPSNPKSSGTFSFKDFTKEQKLVFLSLSIGYISMFCPTSLIAPFFPPEADKHGVSSSLIGLCFSMSALMSVISSPFIGLLIAAIGPKIVIISGIVLNGVFSICFGLLENIESTEWFLTGCFICMGLASFGATAIYTATLTYAAKMFPDNMSLVVGTTEMYIGVAEIIALLSGGFLYDIGGFKLPFILFGTLHLLVIPLDLILLPTDAKVLKDSDHAVAVVHVVAPSEIGHNLLEKQKSLENKNIVDKNGVSTDGEPIKSVSILSVSDSMTQLKARTLANGKKIPDNLRLWHLAAIPRTMLMAFVILVTGICWSFLTSTLEPHLSPLDLTKTETNLMFLLTSVVYGLSSPLWGWLADRMKKTWFLMTAGLTLAGLTFSFLGPLPFLGLQNTVWQNIVCLSIITTTLAAAGIPACEAALLYTIEAGHRDNLATYAIVSSLISTMFSAGAAIGSFAGGHLLENFGYATSSSLCGTICFLWGVFVLGYFIIFHNQPTPSLKSTQEIASESGEITTVVRRRSATGRGSFSSHRLSKSFGLAHPPFHLNQPEDTSNKIIIELTTPTPTLRRKIYNSEIDGDSDMV